MTSNQAQENFKEFKKHAQAKNGLYIVHSRVLKYETCANGKFAVCPICQSIMALNMCGHWVCFMGCGIQIN